MNTYKIEKAVQMNDASKPGKLMRTLLAMERGGFVHLQRQMPRSLLRSKESRGKSDAAQGKIGYSRLEEMNNPRHFAAAAYRYEHQLPPEECPESIEDRYDGEDIQEDIPYDDATETQLAREAEARDIVLREPNL